MRCLFAVPLTALVALLAALPVRFASDVRRPESPGSAIGGFLFARDFLHAAGYVAAGFISLAVMLVILSKPKPASAVRG